MDMDHAYTLVIPRGVNTSKGHVVLSSSIVKQNSEENEENEDGLMDSEHEDSQDDGQYDDFDADEEEHNLDDNMDEPHEEDDAGHSLKADMPDTEFASLTGMTWKVLLPTEEWMQMLPPDYLLQYIRERSVFREPGRNIHDLKECSTPLKRGWLQGAWRETFKEAIAKQTDIPCIIYFSSSNFLKQPFSRKMGPPLWRVRACCRQNDGKCLRFHMKVEDFHPSQPSVEIIISAEGTLLTGPEGEIRHTFTPSDHVRVLKSLQRYTAAEHQAASKRDVTTAGLDTSVAPFTDENVEDDVPVERYQLSVPTKDWISFLPAHAAKAYVLERSRVNTYQLDQVSQRLWSRRVLAPRVTKECRQFLKEALAAKTGLPCRIVLTGRCHLKPPFSRKKRAALFVTNGYCVRNDNKCLSFKFSVQDFDPSEPTVHVDVEVRGVLLTGHEGETRHQPKVSKRTKRVGGFPAGGEHKRQRLDKVIEEAVQGMRDEDWCETVLKEEAAVRTDSSAQIERTIEVTSEDNIELGEEAARELVRLADQALTVARAGSEGGANLTATKIVQSGDQVFIFVSDSDNAPPSVESLEVTDVNSKILNALEGTAEEIVAEEVTTDPLIPGLILQEELLSTHHNPPVDDVDSPIMEYRWQMRLPMAEWLGLLPGKSLRFYLHERTVSREVWVEEGWEKQFRGQMLQGGWRDSIRRALVEQTDVPCQICFRGRSSLKLPFSRKHSAALWRTQAYCAKGEKNCIIYKLWVQDFNPNEEEVVVEVCGTGRMNRDCAKWFTGQGTPVTGEEMDDLSSGGLHNVQIKAELGWDSDLDQGGDDDHDLSAADLAAESAVAETMETEEVVQNESEEMTEATEETVQDSGVVEAAGSAGFVRLYQAVLRNIEELKESLSQMKQCPIKIQAVLRMVRSADSLVKEPCLTKDCLCRPTLGPVEMLAKAQALAKYQAAPASNKQRLAEKDRKHIASQRARVPTERIKELQLSELNDWLDEPDVDSDYSPPPSVASSPVKQEATVTRVNQVSTSRATPVSTARATVASGTRVNLASTPRATLATKPASTPRVTAAAKPASTPRATAAAKPASTPPRAIGASRPSPLVTPASSRLRSTTILTPLPVVRTLSGELSTVQQPRGNAVPKPSQPTIIKLTPSQLAAARAAITAPPTRFPQSKLASAIERSAKAMPKQAAAASPAPNQEDDSEAEGDSEAEAESTMDSSWIMDEMRKVILGTEGEEKSLAEKKRGSEKNKKGHVEEGGQSEKDQSEEDQEKDAEEETQSEEVQELDAEGEGQSEKDAEEETQSDEVQELDAEGEGQSGKDAEGEGQSEKDAEEEKESEKVAKKSDWKLCVKSVVSLAPLPMAQPAGAKVSAPTKPMTRSSRVIPTVSKDAQPPLMQCRKVSPVKTPSASASTSGKVAVLKALPSRAKSSETTSQPQVTPVRTVQTRGLSSVLTLNNATLTRSGKFLILKTNAAKPLVHSTTPKSSS